MFLLDDLKVLWHHGKQYIPDVTKATPPPIYRGRPIIAAAGPEAAAEEHELAELCPTGAIQAGPLSIDMGRCTFCGECAHAAPHRIRFANEFQTATNVRERLIVRAGEDQPVTLDPAQVRSQIRQYFGQSLRLRQISAGGDSSSEWELNACSNANFDMSRFGIEFVASPRHADGIVITGPISANMAEATRICYEAMPSPRLIILAGTDAISGGIFADSPAVQRDFLSRYPIDLYVPGNPVHPLTFINGVLRLIDYKGPR